MAATRALCGAAMKTIAILVAALTLTGCGWFDRAGASMTGRPSSVCVAGVEYLQFISGATVAYTPDGKVKTCSS